MAERVGSIGGGEFPELRELGSVSNVLLLAPSIGSVESDACHTLLGQTPPESTNVLGVTFTQTPAERVERWQEHADGPPARGGIVAVGQTGSDVDEHAWAIKEVENPTDLTGVGIELSELLSGMAAVAEEENETIVACFDSVTSLLQYADLQRTFRFLHVVTGRIKSVDGLGHFHVDPAAHSEQDLATIRGLFDAVVEVNEDGEFTVTR